MAPLGGFLASLRRRKAVRVAAAYLIAAWLVIQIVNNVAAPLGLPDWTPTLVIVLALVGLPLALAVMLALELPEHGAGAPPGARPFGVADSVLIGAVAALIGVSAIQIFADSGAAPAQTAERAAASGAEAPAPADLSIAVLPFADLSPAGDQGYFSDGLSEELLNVLAQISELRVAGRTSSFAFKGQNQDLRVIGDALDVAHILEGSVRKDGDRLRIAAQLVSAADGYHLWSQTYERQMTDIFAVQEEIAMAVADALSITLGVGDVAVAETENLDAYDLYLQAMALNQQPSMLNFLRARTLWRQAVALDPGFLNGWLGLYFVNRSLADWAPDQVDLAEQDAAAQRVIALAPGSTEAAGLAVINALFRPGPDWRAVAEAVETLLDRDRDGLGAGALAVEFPYGDYLAATGRLREAAEMYGRVYAADPLDTGAFNAYFSALAAAGRDAEAEAAYRELARRTQPSTPNEYQHLLLLWRRAGDLSDARAEYEALIARAGDYFPVNFDLVTMLDRPEAASAALRRAYDDPLYQNAARLSVIANMAAVFGDDDLALRALARLDETFGPGALWSASLARLRGDPRFKEIVRRSGLPEHWRETRNWGDFCRPVGADDFECS